MKKSVMLTIEEGRRSSHPSSIINFAVILPIEIFLFCFVLESINYFRRGRNANRKGGFQSSFSVCGKLAL